MTIEASLRAFRDDPSNKQAWEDIVLEMYDGLLAYVGSLLITFQPAETEAAHDIVHDVLLNFYQRWPTTKAEFESASALRGYLRRSCRNLLIDRYRSRRNAEQLISFLGHTFNEVFQQDTEIFRSIFLKEIIAKMNVECRSLFNTYVTEDLSPAEIADREGASPAAFYARWYRCVQRAREIFLQKRGGHNRS